MYLVYIGVSVSVSVSVCVGIYRPPPQNEKYFIDHLSKTLGQLSRQYDKIVLIGDFNLKAGFQHADFSASADFYACADFSANPHMNFHHNADC